MLINGKDASLYSAKLIDRSISTTVVNSLTDWVATAVEGELLHQQYDFKSIRLTFLVTQTNEDAAYKQISALTESLKKCTLRFDDISLDFTCYLDGKAEPIRLQNGVFKVVYLLKNDWGNGELQHVVLDVEPVETLTLQIRYLVNWAPVLTWYTICFDDEKEVLLKQEEKIVEKVEYLNQLSTAESYDQMLLNLGIDLNKYAAAATKLGYVRAKSEFPQACYEFDILYDRYSKDGFQDFPDANYPALVNTTGSTNKYYIDLGVGQGMDVQDLSILVTGRWFESSGGVMIGAQDEQYFSSYFENPTAYFNLGTTPKVYSFNVIESNSTTGQDVVIQTLESIEQLPLRTYGFRSSNRGKAPNPGYMDLLFNGTTLDRVPVDSQELSYNLSLFAGRTKDSTSSMLTGTWCDICRVQIWNKDELILDAIPMSGNLKNCYINTSYENGWWDILHQKYLKWIDVTGIKTAPDFPEILPLDGGEPPEPPTPEPTPPAIRQILQYGDTATAEGDISADKAKSWTGDDAPTTYLSFTAVASQPGETGTWSIYSTSNMKISSTGVLNDGRAYCNVDVTTSTSKSNQYIKFTTSAGNLQQYFNIQSLF